MMLLLLFDSSWVPAIVLLPHGGDRPNIPMKLRARRVGWDREVFFACFCGVEPHSEPPNRKSSHPRKLPPFILPH